MITVCFDFGNSRSKAAVFENNELIETIELTDDIYASVENCLQKYKSSKTILASVIEYDIRIEALLTQKTKFHKVSSESVLNYSILVSKPATIGPDRLALLAAARHYFPENNNLIIAVGTCITYNFINSYGQFLGGAISPGMDMRFKAMHQETAKLPLVQPDWNPPLIGYDTPNNIRSGVIWGITNEIDGFINSYAERYGSFNAVLTGGNSTYFVSQLKNRIFADPNFIFKGLHIISELNN